MLHAKEQKFPNAVEVKLRSLATNTLVTNNQMLKVRDITLTKESGAH